MTKRSVIAGKVMRTPDYDSKRFHAEPDASAPMSSDPAQFKVGLYEDDERTWERDKATLKGMGVDGTVSLAQARINAGLDAPANDNFKAAKVA